MTKQTNTGPIDFPEAFTALTGHRPFPWQRNRC